MNGTELNRTANIGIIRKLYRDGLLSDDAFIAANAALRPISSWFSWARRMLLFFGSVLVLAVRRTKAYGIITAGEVLLSGGTAYSLEMEVFYYEYYCV